MGGSENRSIVAFVQRLMGFCGSDPYLPPYPATFESEL